MSVNQVLFSLTLTPDEELRRFMDAIEKGKIGRDKLKDEDLKREIEQIAEQIGVLGNYTAELSQSVQRSEEEIKNISSSITGVYLPSANKTMILRTFKDIAADLDKYTNQILNKMKKSTKRAIVSNLGETFGVSTAEGAIKGLLKLMLEVVGQNPTDERMLKSLYNTFFALNTPGVDYREVEKALYTVIGQEHQLITKWLTGASAMTGSKVGTHGAIYTNVPNPFIAFVEKLYGPDFAKKMAFKKIMWSKDNERFTMEGVGDEELEMRIALATSKIVSGEWQDKEEDGIKKMIRKIIFGEESIMLRPEERLPGFGALPGIILEALYGKSLDELKGQVINPKAEQGRPDIFMIMEKSIAESLTRSVENGELNNFIREFMNAFDNKIEERVARDMYRILLQNESARKIFEETGLLGVESKWRFMPAVYSQVSLLGYGFGSARVAPMASENLRNALVSILTMPIDRARTSEEIDDLRKKIEKALDALYVLPREVADEVKREVGDKLNAAELKKRNFTTE